MEYIPIERSADAFQQPVEQSHIIAMCQRAFGEQRQVDLAQELGGGGYNIFITTRLSNVPIKICRQLLRH